MRDFKVALRARRFPDGRLAVDLTVTRLTVTRQGLALVAEDITSELEHLDGDVLALRSEFQFSELERPRSRISLTHPVEDGAAFKFVALMHGEKANMKLVAVKLVEDVAPPVPHARLPRTSVGASSGEGVAPARRRRRRR